MGRWQRREFLQYSMAATAGSLLPAAAETGKAMRLGLIVGLGDDPDAAVAKVHALGLPTCQLGVEKDFSVERARRLRAALDRYSVEATAVDSLGPPPHVWDFYEGPKTIGVVPPELRRARVENLKRASDFAHNAGVPAVHTHCGFIPENPNDPLYEGTIAAIREVVSHCRDNGQTFLYETGQETPVTLLRAIQDVGLDNQGINLDTANFILYGKANPLDALDVIGKHVRGMHAKDGLYPTDPRKLGTEVAIGSGKVDFPRIIARLKELGYSGPVTIEREISGPQQTEDVKRAKAYLQRLIG